MKIKLDKNILKKILIMNNEILQARNLLSKTMAVYNDLLDQLET